MCTMISHSTEIRGMAKGADGWFVMNRATVAFDHTTHSDEEHALLIDFTNYSIGTHARLALELDLESGRALLGQLARAILQAEASGL